MKIKGVQKWSGAIGIFLFCMTLTGCNRHTHEWQEATCTTPKTCATCGETEGEALGHTWVEATCSAPKTCSVCGETEGEALEHTLTEANYQQAPVCEVCGATVGEPLQADFDKYNFTYETETDKEYPFTTKCFDSDDLTTGKIVFSDYQTFASDDEHEAKEGYEWKTITFTIVFDDENAFQHGMGGYASVREDFYDCSYSDSEGDENADDKEDSFTVNYNGEDYTECLHESELLEDEWIDKDDGTAYYEGQWKHTFLVPAGYTGITISVLDEETSQQLGDEVDSLEDVMLYKDNEHTVTFRLN